METLFRCDLRPHPKCIYENDKGDMLAEDEEGCEEEYKIKGLIDPSANVGIWRDNPFILIPVIYFVLFLWAKKWNLHPAVGDTPQGSPCTGEVHGV